MDSIDGFNSIKIGEWDGCSSFRIGLLAWIYGVEVFRKISGVYGEDGGMALF